VAALNTRGRVLTLWKRDYALTASLLSESLAVGREIGDRHRQSEALYVWGVASYTQSAYPAARSQLEESLSLAREIGDRQQTANALVLLGLVHGEQGQYPKAKAYAQSVLDWQAASETS
jgi:tetratricopeptide (TPR) repeat protein